MNKRKILLKNIHLISAGFLFLLAVSCSSTENISDYSVHSGYDLDDLNTYGEWVDVNPYGEVWQPFVVNGWMPFDYGHWAFANGNWTWISYEPFGWIVYHYGYWYNDPFYGWVWIPSDNTWAPANVMWITYDDFVGWAPLPPPGIIYGNPWESGEHSHWHVVKLADFTKDNIHDYAISNPPARINELDGTKKNNRVPPSKFTIEQSTGRNVSDVMINHEKVKLPPRQIQKMTLSPDENKRIVKSSQRVRDNILMPKKEFQIQREKSNTSQK